ncbi:NifB/NifX family molybdenum-iron cluster-binding protein [Candidatus Woesearchaeota archaeon]|nr:NifB/NifX family molybdenum-iron cluster-binding protein [Candidatus Woesearchaeota archaeon]
MKIAISSVGKDLESYIDARFGRCPFFLVVEIKEKKIVGDKVIDNLASSQAGGAGMAAAQIIADSGAEVVITENIGPRALDVFNQLQIKVYSAKGKIRDAVNQFIEGKLDEVSAPTGPQHMGLGR